MQMQLVGGSAACPSLATLILTTNLENIWTGHVSLPRATCQAREMHVESLETDDDWICVNDKGLVI